MTEVEVRFRVPKSLLEQAKLHNFAVYGPEIQGDVIRIFGPHVSESKEIERWFFKVLSFAQKYATGKIKPESWELELPIGEN